MPDTGAILHASGATLRQQSGRPTDLLISLMSGPPRSLSART